MYWINVDFQKMLLDISPTFFRDENMKMFMDSMAIPLQNLADKTLYQMQHDSRVIYLEKVLNEYFEVPGYNFMNHVATRTIFIEDADGLEHNWMFNSNEFAEDLIIYNSDESDTQWLDVSPGNYYHFIVNIPTSLAFDELKTRALIDYYKLAGKKYIIQTY